MPDRPDNQTRKDKLNQWRAQQRTAARAKLPLSHPQMQAMFDMLDAELPQQGCDHTFRLLQTWARRQCLAFDAIAAWCHENGGHCDCEVLANCEVRWQDASKE